jgi:hypothetical protein
MTSLDTDRSDDPGAADTSEKIEAEKTTQHRRRSDSYSAVVFVHGMGPQARHENVGQLLEALEASCADPETGVLRQVRPRLEPSRIEDEQDVPFVQLDRFVLPSKPGERRWSFRSRTRAYEVYWSPITARGAWAPQVAGWAVSQLLRPLAIAAGGWRQYTRLRMARLHRLNDTLASSSETPELNGYVLASLLAQIQRFRGHEGRRHQERTGRTDSHGFADFVAAKLGAAWARPAAATISHWSKSHLPIERLTRSTGIGLSLLGAAVVAFVMAAIFTETKPSPTSLMILATLTILAGLVIGRFLTFTFSDVFIWNNNRDHDQDFERRGAVLRQTRNLFEHILRDPNCRRLVIVSHSLGSAIALETLAHMGQRNIARHGLEAPVHLSKISHLFTLGSPIDKIFYFFQTREARTYRAGRLSDDLRGDLSQEPFFRDGRARIDWLNLWDAADPVSDPLYSPLGGETDGAAHRSAKIQNHRVENTRTYSAWKNHVGYLKNPAVVDAIAEAVFLNQTTPPPEPASDRNTLLGAAIAFMARATPWAALSGAALAYFNQWGLGLTVAFAPLAIFVVVLTAEMGRRLFLDRRRRARLKVR